MNNQQPHLGNEIMAVLAAHMLMISDAQACKILDVQFDAKIGVNEFGPICDKWREAVKTWVKEQQ